jgi:hypothetical protein
MRKSVIRWAVMVLACLAAGCGSGGIETGLPKDMSPQQGANPTPDMGPSPNAAPATPKK